MSSEQETDDDPFEEHRIIEGEKVSEAADGFVIDIHGTRVFFKQSDHIPVIVEMWVNWQGGAGECIGTINIAKGEIVTLGPGPSDTLADEVDRIRELPVGEIDEALENLACKLNPAGRAKTEANQ